MTSKHSRLGKRGTEDKSTSFRQNVLPVPESIPAGSDLISKQVLFAIQGSV